MVDLVEDHQRLAVLGAHPVPGRVAGHLRVGDDDPWYSLGGLRVGVGELRVQRDAGGRAACAHWILRCSVGTTTVTVLDGVLGGSSAASAARGGLADPGVATARKSRGLAARYFTSAAAASPAKPGCWALRQPAPETLPGRIYSSTTDYDPAAARDVTVLEVVRRSAGGSTVSISLKFESGDQRCDRFGQSRLGRVFMRHRRRSGR